ncbi:hypothetical protein ACFYVR_16145 [Rhodococcus sp. NPDC003318]|uniref:hypothetical protein n=1 Tax=Rhodococcus sp. NPDC003318 TaxID=3364503 RepID=UPI0036BD06D0
MVQPTGQEEAGQEKAGQEKAAVSPWVTGIVGVIGGVSGAAVTQAGGLYLSRTQRRGDRKITRLESLIKDFEVLDCAIEAANVDDPSPEANRELTVALRKFERTVALIAEKDLRDHATECAKLTLKFAVTRNEPDEEGPTQQEVSDAHTELMERVRKVADSTV